jgi:hypothetical protein
MILPSMTCRYAAASRHVSNVLSCCGDLDAKIDDDRGLEHLPDGRFAGTQDAALRVACPKLHRKIGRITRRVAEMLERVKGIEPSPEAWEAVLGPLILLSISGRSLLVSVLDVRGDSPVFAEILNECAKLCQAFERCCAP